MKQVCIGHSTYRVSLNIFGCDFIFYYCVHSSLPGFILMLMEIVHLCVKLGKLLGILKVIKIKLAFIYEKKPHLFNITVFICRFFSILSF